MKIKEGKHDHKLTNCLKVILFSLVMLAPIGSIAVKCLYTICNKNAYKSYYGETINEVTYNHTNYEDLVLNNTYQINPINIGTQQNEMGSSSYRITFTNAKLLNNNTDISSATSFSVYSTNSGITYINLFDNNNEQVLSINSNNNYILQYDLVSKNLIGTSITLFNLLNNNLLTYNKYSYLDNVFEYSINNIETNNLYNWTQNTGIYTGVSAMCTGMGITVNAIPIILTYWFLITAIYIIVDIVLWGFTAITHILQKKL